MTIAEDTSTSVLPGSTKAAFGGHAIVSFARAWQADEAMRALVELGFGREIVHQGDDPSVIAAIAEDFTSHGLSNASWLARAQLEFAERGRHWLVLRTHSDGRAFQIAECVTSCGATSVQYYGNLVVEELLTKPSPRAEADRPHSQVPRADGAASVSDASANGDRWPEVQRG